MKKEKNEAIQDGRVTYDLLKTVKTVQDITNADKLHLIEYWSNFLTRWWLWIICLMPFALLMQGGIIFDLILICILIISYIGLNYLSNANMIAISFITLSETYTPNSQEAYNNTIKEADYLLPKLKIIDHESDQFVRKQLYGELVAYMDYKYGIYRHMLGESITQISLKEEERKINEDIVRIEQQVEEDGKADVCAYLHTIQREFNLYRYNTSQNKKSLFEVRSHICSAYGKEWHWRVTKATTNWSVKSKLELNRCGNRYDNRFKEIFIEYVGYNWHEHQIYILTNNVNNWKLVGLLYLYIHKLEKLGLNEQDYYSLDNVSCLEGKLAYEYIGALKELVDLHDLFPGLYKYPYVEYYKAVKKHHYTIKDLKDEYIRVANISYR